jgi:hypothetical protein
MIRLSQESPIPLAEACRRVPPARRGRKTHISTLLRWITRGARAPSGQLVRLEAIRLGNRWHTSEEALQRFGEALTPMPVEATADLARTARQRQLAAERADVELESQGI